MRAKEHPVKSGPHSQQRSWRGARWFGLLFLIPGLAVILVGPVHTLYQHLVTAGWQPVPTVLERVALRSHQGDDGTTYSVEADYRYSYGGRDYRGHRVGYDWGSDNITDYHRDLVRRLERARAQGQARVWVNPDNPSESVLVRELRWAKLGFMTLFGGLFSAAGLFILRLGRIRTATEAMARGEPILSSERHGHWLFGFMALMFLGLSLPGVLAIPSELRQDNWPILAVLLFPLVGGWLAWLGWRSWRNWTFYGPAPLVLDPAPGQAGGDVGGRITLARRLAGGDGSLTLQCLRVRISGGKNTRRHESLLWQQDQVPELRHEARSTEVWFRFSPPGDLPATDDEGREQVVWRLMLTGPQTPVPLERTYELPVVQGTLRSSVRLSDSHVRRQEQQARIRAVQAAAEQIDVRTTAGGVELISRAGRHRVMTAMLLLVGLIFAGVGVGLWFKAPDEGATLYLMAGVFGLFGFPMTLGGLFMAGRGLRVRIEGTRVTVIRYWAGRALWQRRGELARADQLVLASGGSLNRGNRTIEYFALEVVDGSRRLRLAEGIAGRPAAEALRDSLVTLLRLS